MGIRQEFQAMLESKTKEELVEIVQGFARDHTRLNGIIQAQFELVSLFGNAMCNADESDDIGAEASAHLNSVNKAAKRLFDFVEALAFNDPASGVLVAFADEGPEGALQIDPRQGNLGAILAGVGKEVDGQAVQ